MRAPRFRPCFDTLSARITPSDLAPVPSGTAIISHSPMPGDNADLVNTGGWYVAGAPPMLSLTNPDLHTVAWYVANP